MSNGRDAGENGSMLDSWPSDHREHKNTSSVAESIKLRKADPDHPHPIIIPNNFASQRSFASQKSEASQKSFASPKSQGPQASQGPQKVAAPPTPTEPPTPDAPQTADASQTPPAVKNSEASLVFPSATVDDATTPISPTTISHSPAPASRVSVVTSTTVDISIITSILPTPTATSVFNATQTGSGHSPQLPTRNIVGIIIPVAILLPVVFILLFLRWRKWRHRCVSSPAAPAAATLFSQDAVTPFPVGTANLISERLAAGGDSKLTAATISSLKTKSAYGICPAMRSESDLAPVLSSAALPVEVAQLTMAMNRAGLSVNALMSSLNRVARVDGNAVDRVAARTSREVMPPQYEP